MTLGHTMILFLMRFNSLGFSRDSPQAEKCTLEGRKGKPRLPGDFVQKRQKYSLREPLCILPPQLRRPQVRNRYCAQQGDHRRQEGQFLACSYNMRKSYCENAHILSHFVKAVALLTIVALLIIRGEYSTENPCSENPCLLQLSERTCSIKVGKPHRYPQGLDTWKGGRPLSYVSGSNKLKTV